MTTQIDCGTAAAPPMLQCLPNSTNLYSSLTLALRDMRGANGRDPETGAGAGNRSWIGLSLAMIVLDTLSGSSEPVGTRWEQLLTSHRIPEDDAGVIYALRCSLLHGYGYGLPQPRRVGGRDVLLSPDPVACAVGTSGPGRVLFSVPVFCGRLVERIAAESPGDWDTSLINTNVPFGSKIPGA